MMEVSAERVRAAVALVALWACASASAQLRMPGPSEAPGLQPSSGPQPPGLQPSRPQPPGLQLAELPVTPPPRNAYLQFGLDSALVATSNMLPTAVEAARQSDVALLFVGEEAILSGEAHSRAYLDLPGAQKRLVDEVAAAGKPVVLVVLAGRPLTIPDVFDKARAVLYAWHPGTMSGPALADLLFGVESPSGKLPVTFPKTEGQIPVYYAHKNTGRPPSARKLTLIDDIPLRARQSSLGDAARYLDIGYEPLYPFGYGLSYASFRYANLKLASDRVKRSDTLRVQVDLTNTGARAADEIAQLYVRDLVGSLTRPVKELKGFSRVRLAAGETRTLTFDVPVASLGFHDASMRYVVEPGAFRLWVGGDSRASLEAGFEVVE